MQNFIIITGGSKGIGEKIVEKSIEEGYSPIIVSRTPPKPNDFLKDKALYFKVDLANPNEIDGFYKEIDQQKIFATRLVNNAGILYSKPPHLMSVEEMDHEWAVNLRAVILMSAKFAERIINKNSERSEVENSQDKIKGSIVNISSIIALTGATSDVVYAATKAGVSSLARTFAQTYSEVIRANAIAPGFVGDTEMGSKVPAERAKAYINNSLTKIPIQTDAIADMVMYLMSDKAKNITGATYEIANGVYLR